MENERLVINVCGYEYTDITVVLHTGITNTVCVCVRM